MAVVAVGDIDAAQIENADQELFGPLKARAPEAEVPDDKVPIPSSMS